uniref:BLOC-1-related complex subunit 5 n=1 Tax=Caenorhabditis tropicalis TaxID=1561998 RepID=A0A1I7U5A4_9PELO
MSPPRRQNLSDVARVTIESPERRQQQEKEDSEPPVLEAEEPSGELIPEEKGEDLNLSQALQRIGSSSSSRNADDDVICIGNDPFPDNFGRKTVVHRVYRPINHPGAHRLRPIDTTIGSNTSKPAAQKVLENRKRELQMDVRPVKKAAGEVDIAQMLKTTPPVKLEVNVGGATEEITEEFVKRQKETLGEMMRAASTHSLLIGSMIINGLNTLKEKPDLYNQFTRDVNDILAKYKIQ